MPRVRKLRCYGDTIGVTTRRMSKAMGACTCISPVLYLGAVAFKRSENNNKIIENATWDIEKLGNPECFTFVKNLDQLLVEIWKELPIFVAQDTISMEFSQTSDDSEEVREYYYKKMLWCEHDDCGEIISWDEKATKCIYCDRENNLENCDLFSNPPTGKFLRIYPDRFKPMLAYLRNWFETAPTLDMVGLEIGIATYNFGARVRRQLKVFPRVYHVDSEYRLGKLNSGQSNKCLPVPDEVRYKGWSTEKWYSNLFQSESMNHHVIFLDKNYLLGDESTIIDNRSSAWR